MDPYVVCQVGGSKHKGKCSEGAGKKPVFQDSFTFADKDGDLLNVEVWD
jgi:hypothetical protein